MRARVGFLKVPQWQSPTRRRLRQRSAQSLHPLSDVGIRPWTAGLSVCRRWDAAVSSAIRSPAAGSPLPVAGHETVGHCIFYSSVLQFHGWHFHVLIFNALRFYVLQIHVVQFHVLQF